MLALVTDFGKENGFERLVVRSNVMRNRAHGFYLKNGFAEKKQQKVFEKFLLPKAHIEAVDDLKSLHS